MAFVYSSALKRRINFHESIVACLGNDSESTTIHVFQDDSDVDITSKHPSSEHFFLKRPSFCPFYHLNREEGNSFPHANVRFKHVAVAVAVLLYDPSTHSVLLTRRPAHLRAFPHIWVPPGGHVDAGETLHSAVLRELFEETEIDLRGIVTDSNDPYYNINRLRPLCAWESTYPPHLALGSPIRHHLILYYALECSPHLISVLTESKQKGHFSTLFINPETLASEKYEVDAFAWLSPSQCQAIVSTNEELVSPNFIPDESESSFETLLKEPSYFKSWNLTCEGRFEFKERPLEELTKNSLFNSNQPGKHSLERVSTGTKFAIHHFLKLHGYL